MKSSLRNFWPKKWPSKKQWYRFPEALNKKEVALFSLLAFITVSSLIYFSVVFYYQNTEKVPGKGGIYKEGIIESSRWININPIYDSYNEVGKDITEITFAKLLDRNEEGNFVPALAEKYHTEDNKVFEIKLREEIFWSDGQKITADDVVFTVEKILNPEYGSSLREQWTGVDVEKINEREVRFSLEGPSSIFLENLQLKIIPKHIFSDYSPQDFRYSTYNMEPVGSGPYRFKELKEDEEGKIKKIELERNPYYFSKPPYIDEVYFLFFDNKEHLFEAKEKGEIDGFVLPDGKRKEEELSRKRFYYYQALLPRYFALFFNLQSENISSDPEVRKALSLAIDKQKLNEVVLGGKGDIVDSPLLPQFYNLERAENVLHFDLEKAQEILKNAGYEDGKKKTEDVFSFSEQISEGSQGDEVRNLQRCFIYLDKKTEDEDDYFYQDGEVTGFFDERTKDAVINFQETFSEEILAPHNFTKGTGMVAGSTGEKLNELCADLFDETIFLEFTITTLDNPMLVKTAEEIKRQWSELGVEVTINKKSSSDLREKVVYNRDFEMLLFGVMLTEIPNPLPLWHSSKINYPGLNFSGYENEEADQLMEEMLITREKEEDIFKKLQEKIIEENPAIFLYNPYFFYSVAEKVNGIKLGNLANSSERFSNIEKWYIKTKRTWK